MTILKTVCGTYFQIDDEDLTKISEHRWYLVGGYIQTQIEGVTLWLHRFLLEATNSELVDHRDRNPLNNQKYNLRVASYSQNAANSGLRKNNTTGFKGVYRSGKKWKAKIMVNGKQSYLGTFDTPEQAARKYDIKAKEAFGEFAWLNFP